MNVQPNPYELPGVGITLDRIADSDVIEHFFHSDTVALNKLVVSYSFQENGQISVELPCGRHDCENNRSGTSGRWSPSTRRGETGELEVFFANLGITKA